MSNQHTEQGVGPAKGFMSRLGNHAYGVAFLLVVASLIGLSIASFKKVFTDVVMVSLETDRVGSQAQEASDVKARPHRRRGPLDRDDGAGRAPGPGSRPGDGAADPGRRQCPPAAQDPVR